MPVYSVVISAHNHKGHAKTLKNSAEKDVLVTQAWSYSAAYADKGKGVLPRVPSPGQVPAPDIS
jgi:hypothetical protein